MSSSLGAVGRSLPRLRPLLLLTRSPRRMKGNIFPHKKPRWVPLADSTLLSPPARDFSPEEELEQMNLLHHHYHEHLSAVAQYLYEEHLVHSDKGEAAAAEAKKEEEEHARLVTENEEENKRVAERRRLRLEEEMKAKEAEAARAVEEARAKEEARLRAAKEEVEREEEALSAAIVTREALAAAIEAALDSPADHEFAIDAEGHIYRGRYTRSTEVPEAHREKIPAPPPFGMLDLDSEERASGR